MSGQFVVTVHMEGKDILGNELPPEGALEQRTYAALSADHAREAASKGLLDTEEIVSVEAKA